MTVTYFALYNCALAGAAAGMSSQKQALYESSGSPVEPADSNVLLTTSAGYAAEVDALLVTMTPSTVTTVIDMVNDGATVIPTNAALADASAYLPVVMALMSKSTMDGRGIPTNSTTGAVYAQADWTASGIPNGVVAYFLAFSENAFVDGADTVQYVPLANVAMGAAMAGMISNRQELYNGAGAPLTPASFPVQVATARAFALEVDAQLGLQAAALGGSFPANISGIVGSSPYSTTVPSTAALTNALYSLVPAMGAIVKAIFDNRGVPVDRNGNVFVQPDYADIANAVVAQFIEYAGSVETT